LLHTHPSIYHPRCIMFFSQYFRFPSSQAVPARGFTKPRTAISLIAAAIDRQHIHIDWCRSKK
jgi:hypothetical protein